MLSSHCVGTCQGNELTRNSSGSPRSQSSQIAEPVWTDPNPNLKNGIVARKVVSTFGEIKIAQTGNDSTSLIFLCRLFCLEFSAS